MTGNTDAVKELYRFIDGNGSTIHTFTNSDEAETYDSGSGPEVYVPVPIGRSEPEGNGEMTRQNLTVTFSIDNATAKGWFVNSIDFTLSLTIFSKTGTDVEVEWKGRLISVSPKLSTIDFVFENVFTSMRRMGLYERYQINCPHALYGQGCNIDKASFAVSSAVTLVAGTVITVPAASGFADGYFNGGIFEDNAGNLRFIISHVGNQITLIRPLNMLIDYVTAHGYSGLTCHVFPGCDRTTTTCNGTFNNILNYGGFPFMPVVNPFTLKSLV